MPHYERGISTMKKLLKILQRCKLINNYIYQAIILLNFYIFLFFFTFNN